MLNHGITLLFEYFSTQFMPSLQTYNGIGTKTVSIKPPH